MARRSSCRDETFARVADTRRAGIRHDRDALPRVETIKQLRYRAVLGVIVDEAQLAGADPGVLQQSTRSPGVLAAHHIGPCQLLDRAWREVTEVADRRGYEHERAPIDHARTSTMSPGRRPHLANDPASASTTDEARRTGRQIRFGFTDAVRSTSIDESQ
ncbi:unannotated protein [freshwater metagenome]|uniref:Unannotated protein n=1 Tax=freshwater metagenome TaxID=449393 RepID=A0A6J7JCY6_9ZZZZ